MARLEIEEQVQMLNDPKLQIPWAELNRWGLTKEVILQADRDQRAEGAVVNKFAHHGYSPVFDVKPDYRNNDIRIIGEMRGAVRFYTSGDAVKLEFQLARKAYRMDEDIYINDRTVLHANSANPEERIAHDNLVKYGFAGMPVEVNDPRFIKECGSSKQMCLVALDMSNDTHEGTNQVQFVRVDWVKRGLERNGDKICGAVLTEDEKKAYLAGEEVFLRNMKSKRGSFDCYVRYDPVNGMIGFSNSPAMRQTEAAAKEVKVSEEQQQEVAEAKKRSRGVTR